MLAALRVEMQEAAQRSEQVMTRDRAASQAELNSARADTVFAVESAQRKHVAALQAKADAVQHQVPREKSKSCSRR